MKKKIVSLLLVGVMIASFTACGSSSKSNSSKDSSKSTGVDVASEDENTLSVSAWEIGRAHV